MTPLFAAARGAAALLLTTSALAVPAPPELANVRAAISTMSVPFVPNAGQWDSKAAFAAQTFAGTLFVTTEGKLVYSLNGRPIAADNTTEQGSSRGRRGAGAVARTAGWVLTETPVNARQQPLRAAPAGSLPQKGKVSYAIGNDESKHRDGLSSYERVNLGEVYPGIDMQVRATGNNVEKIFTVAPRRDPRQIRIRLDGAQHLEVGPQGELIAHTGNGPVTYTAPIAYQEDASGSRTTVPVRYALDGSRHSYGFRVGAYDTRRALVIDPLLQSTYLGGSGSDFGLALAIHPSSGEVYVAGSTSSANFPKVAGAEQPTKSTGTDAFVTRLNAALTTRLQSTYLGGTGFDQAYALAIHPATGEVYVAGNTTSTNFPDVAGAEQTTKGTGTSEDAFVTRLNAALTTRLQSTYLGGDGIDEATALAIHPATGEVYVAGNTASTNFPKVAGAEQTTKAPGTNSDTFITRLNAALTARLQSTYLGGNGIDQAYALAIHPATGEVYVAGSTESGNFPKVAGAEQTTKGTSTDAFVTRLNAALTVRLQSTYLGGNSGDAAAALAIHPATGEVYVAGDTFSTDFPKVAGAEQTINGSGFDAFVTRLNAALTTRLQSTYLGGNGLDKAVAVAIHPTTGDVYVAGITDSTNFPKVAGAEQATKGTDFDAFVTRLNGSVTMHLQSTYLGGNSRDEARALAIHPATGEVYVAGITDSTNFPKVAGGEQTTGGGSATFEAFISRYSTLLAGEANPLLAVSIGGSGTGTVTSGTPGIVCPGDCSHTYPAGSSIVLTAGATGGSVFTGWLGGVGGCTGTNTTCTVVVSAATTVSATFAPPGHVSALNIDGNATGSRYDALTDGLLVLRYLFGLTGTALTNAAVGPAASRVSPAAIKTYLDNNRPKFDVDGNGQADASTDGLLVLRYLFGLRGASLITGAIGPAATRNTADAIETYLLGLLPP